jgi:hypothetical protein
MNLKRLAILSFVPLLALAACSSSDSTTPPADAGARPDAPPVGDADAGKLTPKDGGSDAADAGSDAADAGSDAADASQPSACGDAGALASPPPDPHGPAATGTGTLVYAVDSWSLGEEANQTAWKANGFDIDCAATTLPYAGCTPTSSNATSHLVDGPGGIDNSFGENVMPVLGSLLTDSSTTVSNSATMGGTTMLIAIEGLPSPLASTSSMKASLYGAAPLGALPKFDGSDVWPVDDATVSGGDVTKPLMTFGAGYATGSSFVSGSSQGSIVLSLADLFPRLPLTHVVLQLQLSADGKSITRGNLSGILSTKPFVDDFRAHAGNLSTALCAATAFDQVAASIEAAQDILPDGTNPSGQPCGAISIGLGFTAKAVKLGPAKTIAPQKSACVDGGP